MAEDMMDVESSELNHPEAPPGILLGTRAGVTAVPYPKAILDQLVYSLEEGMDSKALDFLTHVSYAGISTPLKPHEDRKGIQIPPPEVLAIVTNLSLHPTYTTRQVGLYDSDVAIKASRYLRTITRLAGATNCQLQSAWQFKRSSVEAASALPADAKLRRMRNRNVAKTGVVARKGRHAGTHEIDTTPFANLEIANEESVFKRCDDIWSVVGWALVCSCVYKKRWDVWRDFLELLLEVLLNDFQERIYAAPDPQDMDIQGSLITAVGLLPDLAGGAGYKRIVRAIFANGSEKSRNEWTPVYPKETKKPPKKEYKTWKHNLDTSLYAAKKRGEDEHALERIRDNAARDYKKFRDEADETTDAYREFRDKLALNGSFGDDESDEEEESGVRPAKKDDKAKLETHEEALEVWGGVQSIIIRLKLMELVSEIGAAYERCVNKQRQQQNTEALFRRRSKRKRRDSLPETAVSSKREDSVVSGVPVAVVTTTTTTTTITTPTKRGSVKLRTPQFPREQQKDGLGAETTSIDSPTLPHLPTEESPSPHLTIHVDPKTPSRLSSEAEGQYVTAPTSQCETSFYFPAPDEQPPSSPPKPLSQKQNSPLIIILPQERSQSPLSPLPSKSPTPPTSPFLQKPPQSNHPPPPLQLTYAFAHDIPTLSCFYTEFTDHLRGLPIKQLLLFTSSSIYPCIENPTFKASVLTTILQRSMVFQPKGGWSTHTDSLTDSILESWYFPHYARGTDVESQLRMSALLEALARLWHVNAPGGGVGWSEGMEKAVEAGILVRREKAEVAVRKKKKATEADEEMLRMLAAVEGRLRGLMGIARARAMK